MNSAEHVSHVVLQSMNWGPGVLDETVDGLCWYLRMTQPW